MTQTTFTAIGERDAFVVRVVRNRSAVGEAEVDCGHQHPTRSEAEGRLKALREIADAKWGDEMFIEIVPEWNEDDDAEDTPPTLGAPYVAKESDIAGISVTEIAGRKYMTVALTDGRHSHQVNGTMCIHANAEECFYHERKLYTKIQ